MLPLASESGKRTVQQTNQKPGMRYADGARRYLIHEDEFLTCTLVYQPDSGWFVDKTEAKLATVRLTLYDFDRGDTGKRLASQVATAIANAQDDL